MSNKYWDISFNPFGGCTPVSPGCRFCYAARLIPQQQAHKVKVYEGVVSRVRGRPVFNGTLRTLEPGHPLWVEPLLWPGADNPVMGADAPSLIFIGDMSDVFVEGRPKSDIDRAMATVAASDHLGLVLTKHPARMANYFQQRERWKSKLWLGASAENQRWFDQRLPAMRQLARRGWLTFFSLAPLIGPIRLPDDFNPDWVIVNGEEGPHDRIRPMDLRWVRAIRDQCVERGIPLFVRGMGGKRAVPRDLKIRQFPTEHR